MGAMPSKFLAIQGMGGIQISVWSELFQLEELLSLVSAPLHYDLAPR